MDDNLIGQEIEAFCTKCKEDTLHTITAVSEDDEIEKVMCKICMSYHKYKSPMDSEPKAIKVKIKKEPTTPKKTRSRRIKNTKLLEEADFSSAIEYRMDINYNVAMPIHHKTFGFGVVKNIIDNQKMEVIFQDCERMLVQNYQL